MKRSFAQFIANFFSSLFGNKKTVKLGIYGPVNAGKTTLANKICKDWIGEELGTVSKIPHETREIQVKEKVKVKIVLSGDQYKVRRLASRNELKIKESPQNGKFFVIDKKELLLMIQPENSQDEVGVWVNSPYFANSFTSMLENGK